MLENDLNMRNQFASKIIDKVKKINDDIKLLSKVDKQLLKNINKKVGNIENFHINKIGGGPVILDDSARGAIYAQNLLKLEKLKEAQAKLISLKKKKEANDKSIKDNNKKNKEAMEKLDDITDRVTGFIDAFDKLNGILSDFEVPELDELDFKNIEVLDTTPMERLEKLIPKEIHTYTDTEVAEAYESINELKQEYDKLVNTQIPKYKFVPISGGGNDYTKEVIWTNDELIFNVGGAYYTVLYKLLKDTNLKHAYDINNLKFFHKKLGITEPDKFDGNISPVYDAYTYLIEQEALKEKKVKEKEKLEKILKDPSRKSEHATTTAQIDVVEAEIVEINKTISMATKNYNKMIGKSADADIDDKNTKTLDDAQTTITNYEAALSFLRPTGGNITSAAAAAAKNVAAQTILNALTPAPNIADNITNLADFIADLITKFNTATAINALRIAIRENPDDNNTNIFPKITTISSSVDKIIKDEFTAASDDKPRSVLASLKAKTPITMVGGGRSSRRNSSRTSRHNSSRTSRHDSSSTSRHSGW